MGNIYPLIVTQKSDISDGTKVPMGHGRYIVLEDTRELYYDNDNNQRYKLRDIQILNTYSDLNNVSPYNKDIFYVIDENSLYYYNGTDFIKIITGSSSGTNKVTATITGDGTSKEFVVTHNLNTLDVIVQIYDTTTLDTVYTTIYRADVNNIIIGFENPPQTTDNYKVIII